MLSVRYRPTRSHQLSSDCINTVLHTDKHKPKVTVQTNGLFTGVISRTARALEMNSKPPLRITGLRSFLNRKWAKHIWKLSYLRDHY